jgi:DNA modification methylase
MTYQIISDNCLNAFKQNKVERKVDLTFLDPPFNQQKDYAFHNDSLDDHTYWQMMEEVCSQTFDLTNEGGSIYFMQREKNTEFVLRTLRKTGWEFQNLIIWKKKTSAVPVANKFGKHYQIIAFATKGLKAKTFHRLRIDPELPASYKQQRENGIFVTDVWDDIRELTSGYFAGNEAIRTDEGERFHKQQAPLALLLRIILSSTKAGDTVFDPFAGTGTTLVVAHQLQRHSIGIEIDPNNVRCIQSRLEEIREADLVARFFKDYTCSENLEVIWGEEVKKAVRKGVPCV